MTGRPQKPAGQRVDARNSRLRVVPRGGAGGAPAPSPPPPEAWGGGPLGVYACDRWRSFWKSSVAGLVDLDADLDALNEWICAIDERARVAPEIAADLLTSGSKGQQRLNPLVSYVQQLNRAIERAEEGFGMTPLARMRLGVESTNSHDVFAQMLADLEAIVPEDDRIPAEYLDDN